MIKAFDITQTREYSLNADTIEPKTVFILGVLDSALSRILFDNTFHYSRNANGPDALADISISRFTLEREIVRFGLKGWRGFLGRDGKEIEFSEREHLSSSPTKAGNRKGLTDRALDLLKPYLSELAGQIEQDNILAESDKKKSELQSESSVSPSA